MKKWELLALVDNLMDHLENLVVLQGHLVCSLSPYEPCCGTYTMIFLKWNRLNWNCSGCEYYRDFIDIASESPWKTVNATFFTFWVAAPRVMPVNGINAYGNFLDRFFLLTLFPHFLTGALTTPFPARTSPFEDLTIFRVIDCAIWASCHPF